jgi:hypothetical protein
MTKFPKFPIGATGRFPQGKVDEHDEGELSLALAADHQYGIVRVVFGKRIAWLGLPASEAREFAKMLIEKADELDKRRT